MIAAAEKRAPAPGTTAACDALGVARSTLYRRRRPRPPAAKRPKRRSPRALSEPERQAVLDVAHSERFIDQAPASIVATLLDEETGTIRGRRAR
jgi:putative transposase